MANFGPREPNTDGELSQALDALARVRAERDGLQARLAELERAQRVCGEELTLLGRVLESLPGGAAVGALISGVGLSGAPGAIVHLDAEGVAWHVSAMPLQDAQGQRNGVLCLAFASTPVGHLEQEVARKTVALLESEARFRHIFETAPIGIALLDAAGFLVESNRAFQAMLGYDAAELSRMTVHAITHPDDRPVAGQLFEEQSLRESWENYQRLVERSPDPIAVHDGEVVRYVNPAMVALLRGEKPEDIVGRPVLSIARALVEAHGGQIGVTSEPGHGATFWFSLPVGGPVLSAPDNKRSL